jgi:hypothetical protein
MSFESCFGGSAGSKSAPAAMGGLPTFADPVANGWVAPKAAIRGTATGKARLLCKHLYRTSAPLDRLNLRVPAMLAKFWISATARGQRGKLALKIARSPGGCLPHH